MRADTNGRLDPLLIEQLARQASAGDRTAFRELVNVTHEHMYRLALRVGPGENDATDIVQETYLRVWQHLPRLTHHGAALAWIFGICRNAATDALRTKKRKLPEIQGDHEAVFDLADPAICAEGRMRREQTAMMVSDAVLRIKEKYRVVLLLFYVDEFSTQEIAASLGIPVGTVESRLHRGRLAAGKEISRQRGRKARRTA